MADIVVLDWPTSLAALENNGAQPADPKHIKKYDGTEVDNGALWGAGTGSGYFKGAVKANSVEDMVNKILKSLKPGECINSIAMVGHGSPGCIGTGDGQTNQPGNHINNNRKEWDPQLSKLCDKFCKDAPEIEILLLGCDTGVCDDGAAKLYELAKFFKACAKDAKGKFCVYGTKGPRTMSDHEDTVKNKRRDNLVKVCSDAADKPGCLTRPTSEGAKKKKKKEKQKEKQADFPRPRPADFSAVAFRDSRTIAGKRAPIAFLSPQPISVADFLKLYDFSTAYEPEGLTSKIDGEAILQRADGSTETLLLLLDYKALRYTARTEDYLYFLKDLTDRIIVKDLVAGAVKDC